MAQQELFHLAERGDVENFLDILREKAKKKEKVPADVLGYLTGSIDQCRKMTQAQKERMKTHLRQFQDGTLLAASPGCGISKSFPSVGEGPARKEPHSPANRGSPVEHSIVEGASIGLHSPVGYPVQEGQPSFPWSGAVSCSGAISCNNASSTSSADIDYRPPRRESLPRRTVSESDAPRDMAAMITEAKAKINFLSNAKGKDGFLSNANETKLKTLNDLLQQAKLLTIEMSSPTDGREAFNIDAVVKRNVKNNLTMLERRLSPIANIADFLFEKDAIELRDVQTIDKIPADEDKNRHLLLTLQSRNPTVWARPFLLALHRSSNCRSLVTKLLPQIEDRYDQDMTESAFNKLLNNF